MTTLFFKSKLERNNNFRYRVYIDRRVEDLYREMWKIQKKERKKKRKEEKSKRKFLVEILAILPTFGIQDGHSRGQRRKLNVVHD